MRRDRLDMLALIRTIYAMSRWSVWLLLLLAACFLPKAQTSGSEVLRGTAPDFMYRDWAVGTGVSAGRYLGKFKITFYWAVDESEYPQSKSSRLYLADGQLLGAFSQAFVRAFKVEAAAVLRDGRLISYLKRANRVEVVDRFLGSGGHRLTELRSVAVDPRIVPIGSRLYIPQADNVTVDGRTMNGVFYANDVGSAVRGKHIDIFIGRRQNMDAFSAAGMRSSGSVDVYILE
jgi:3D (Asp-Asp-Asp) domain-containing protein